MQGRPGEGLGESWETQARVRGGGVAVVPSSSPTHGAFNMLANPVTAFQVSQFEPLPHQTPALVLSGGSAYYGDVDTVTRKPNGCGIMLFKNHRGGFFTRNREDHPYKAGDRYGGHWSRGLFDGEGVLITSTYTYQGTWLHGQMHGRGNMTYERGFVDRLPKGAASDPAGESSALLRGLSFLSPFDDGAPKPKQYVGDFDGAHLRHGSGLMRYFNGDVYEGCWSDNRRHGFGKLIRSDGEVYEGYWEHDRRHGYGTITAVDGTFFKGAMQYDRRSGDGLLRFPNGDEYHGHFEQNVINGSGTMRYSNGDIYEGEWKKGIRHGAGKYTLKRRAATMEGTFVKGLIQGTGRVEFPGISTFVGDFDQGERRHGTLFWHNGANTEHRDKLCYQGEWNGESMHGRGILWFLNGDFYYGPFVQNQRTGKGNMCYADGSQYSGELLRGQRHGWGLQQVADGSIEAGWWRQDAFICGYTGEWNGEAADGVGRLRLPVAAFLCTHGSAHRVVEHLARSETPAGGPEEDGIAPSDVYAEFIGHFRAGVREGAGVLTLPALCTSTSGTVPSGGARRSAEAETTVWLSAHVLAGPWRDDGLDGAKGVWRFPTGEVYVGGFVEGRREGPRGRLWRSEGSLFEGPWRGDAPCGSGRLRGNDVAAPLDHRPPPAARPGGDEKDHHHDDEEEEKKNKKNNNNNKKEEEEDGGAVGRRGMDERDRYVLYGVWTPATAAPEVPGRLETSHHAGSDGSTMAGGAPSRRRLPARVALRRDLGLPAMRRAGESAPAAAAPRAVPDVVPVGWQTGRGLVCHPSGICVAGDWLANHPRPALPYRPFSLWEAHLRGLRALAYLPAEVEVPLEAVLAGAPAPPPPTPDFPGVMAADAAAAAEAAAVPRAASLASCGGCHKPYTFFRTETRCALCLRPRCAACLAAPEIAARADLPALVAESARLLERWRAGETAAEDVECGDGPPAASAMAGPGGGGRTVAVCADCAQSLRLELRQETRWIPQRLFASLRPGERGPVASEEYVVYAGYTSHGVPHLYGALWWGREGYYVGGFQHGRREGYGTQYLANGEKYMGGFHRNVWGGVGSYFLRDGAVLQGRFHKGVLRDLHYHGEVDEQLRPHGRGVSYEGDGSTYNGEWRHGLREGSGRLVFAGGAVYGGDFVGGVPSGSAVLVTETSTYHGRFERGRRHGAGVEFHPTEAWEGRWREDLPHGCLRRYQRDGSYVHDAAYDAGNERADCFLVPEMVEDRTVTQCGGCGAGFGLLLRRHHCRLCGGVVCHACSPHRAPLPAHFPPTGPQRVCTACRQRLEQRRQFGVRRYANGTAYAGCWSQGRWVSRGLYTRPDGLFIVLDVHGQPLVGSNSTTISTHSNAPNAAAAAPPDLLDAAPPPAALDALEVGSSGAELEAFLQWWSAMQSTAGLAVPLDLPLVRLFQALPAAQRAAAGPRVSPGHPLAVALSSDVPGGEAAGEGYPSPPALAPPHLFLGLAAGASAGMDGAARAEAQAAAERRAAAVRLAELPPPPSLQRSAAAAAIASEVEAESTWAIALGLARARAPRRDDNTNDNKENNDESEEDEGEAVLRAALEAARRPEGAAGDRVFASPRPTPGAPRPPRPLPPPPPTGTNEDVGWCAWEVCALPAFHGSPRSPRPEEARSRAAERDTAAYYACPFYGPQIPDLQRALEAGKTLQAVAMMRHVEAASDPAAASSSSEEDTMDDLAQRAWEEAAARRGTGALPRGNAGVALARLESPQHFASAAAVGVPPASSKHRNGKKTTAEVGQAAGEGWLPSPLCGPFHFDLQLVDSTAAGGSAAHGHRPVVTQSPLAT